MWEVHKPLSPPKEFQKLIKACKINDLQDFIFLDSSQIIQYYRFVGAEIGVPQK